MPTIIHTLSPKDRAFLHHHQYSGYLRGQCYALAIALHRGLGWPLIGLMHDDVVEHAAVRTPEGGFLDARGVLLDKDSFAEPFGYNLGDTGFEIAEIGEERLIAIRKDLQHGHVIESARHLAETIWPELPWKETYADRVKKFADELEALSRKHGLWIASSVPADLPRIYKGDGEEIGYEVSRTLDGNGYMINRKLS